MSDILDAKKVFADAPEPPPVTQSVVEQDQPAATPADKPASTGTGPVDAKGTPFDPSLHQVKSDGSPNTRKDGTYVPKGGRKPKAAAKATSESVLAPEDTTTPATGATTEATTETETEPEEPPITPAQAEATAEGITATTWSLAGIALGPEWVPTEEERKTWKDYWQRVSIAYNIRFPLLIEGLLYAITSCGKRVTTANKDSRWGRFLAWAKGAA